MNWTAMAASRSTKYRNCHTLLSLWILQHYLVDWAYLFMQRPRKQSMRPIDLHHRAFVARFSQQLHLFAQLIARSNGAHK